MHILAVQINLFSINLQKNQANTLRILTSYDLENDLVYPISYLIVPTDLVFTMDSKGIFDNYAYLPNKPI